MLPIYIGAEGEENQGLCTGSENYWCVNKNAAPEDIQATLDFLELGCNQLMKDATALAKDMGFVTPFKTFKTTIVADNPSDTLQMTIHRCRQDLCMHGASPQCLLKSWKNGVGSALLEYAQGTGDWDGCCKRIRRRMGN